MDHRDMVANYASLECSKSLRRQSRSRYSVLGIFFRVRIWNEKIRKKTKVTNIAHRVSNFKWPWTGTQNQNPPVFDVYLANFHVRQRYVLIQKIREKNYESQAFPISANTRFMYNSLTYTFIYLQLRIFLVSQYSKVTT